MINTTHRPSPPTSVIVPWRSLNARIIIFTLTFFLVGIWPLAFYASYTLKNDMERTLSDQQFSTVSIVASDINNEMEDRMKSLEMMAARISPAILGSAAATQKFLESQIPLESLFNYGGIVTRLDCVTIADIPVSGRVGINYSDREYMAAALNGKAAIGKPVLGKKSQAPVFMMTVPIRDAKGKVTGVLGGATDLNKPNFLGKITDHGQGKTGGYMLIAPQHKLIVTATDKSRIMQPMPVPGINPLFDRYVQGFEGSGTVVDSRGLEVLSSAKKIPVADWLLVARIPTKEAFAPIYAMQQRMLLAAILLTLLAGGLTWWILRRQLAPIFATIKTLATLSNADHPLQLLPIRRQDEIGALIGGFNHLLGALKKREDALRESEEKFRNLFNNAEVGIFRTRLDGSEVMEVNRRFLDIVGMTLEETLGKPSVNLWADPKEREEMVKMLVADGSVSAFEYTMLNKRQGEVRNCLTSLRLYREQGILEGSILDITDRRRAEDALRESQERYRTLIETTGDLIYTTDRKGFLTYMNPTLERTLGYAKHEWNGKTFAQIIAPECIDSVKDHFKRAMKGDSIPAYEVDLIRKDGARLSVEFNVVTIHDSEGKPSGRYGIGRDITERKRAEEAFRESEKRLQSIVDGSPIPAFVIGKDHRVIHWNKALEEISRIRPAEVLGTREHWKAFYNEERPCMADLLVDESVELVPQWYSGKYIKSPLIEDAYEATDFFHALGQDGKWMRFTAAAIRDSNGIIVAAIETLEDITEHKRAEEALRRSETNYRSVIENIQDVFYRSDVHGNLIMASPSYVTLLGYESIDDCLCKSIAEVAYYDPEKRKELLRELQGKGSVTNYEVVLKRRDGTPVTVETNSHIYLDDSGNIAGIEGTFRDMTERKQAAESLRESEEKFRSVVEKSSVGIAIIDDTFLCTYVNKECCNIVGYLEQEVLGKNFTFLLAEESKLLVAERYQRRQRGEDVPAQYEFSFVQKTGQKRIGEVRSAVFLDSSGKINSLLQVIDITDRKQAEEERRVLHERLNRAEKMEALGTLAGGVAHDLNNVLGVLSGYSELLLMEIPEGSRSRGHVEKILKSTGKGAAIIEDLLTLARRGVTVSDVINLNNVVSDFLKAPVLEKMKDYHPRVTFSAECDNNLLNIKGSPLHLEKTVMNLVSNAAEAISGKGEVTIRTESRYLDKPVMGYDEIKEGDYAVLTVSDTGMGIPAENVGKIFEPFYTKKTMGRSGTGLGLAIVWGTVKDHNGYIDLQTDAGKGTTFTLYFPVTREELIAPQQQKEPIEQYMGKGESVLVVDDIAEQRDIAARLLTSLGYEVHVVSSGEEAVEYLKWSKVDIFVLDMIMAPGIDGLETYQRVLKINPTQKAIIVSGYSETERVREAQRLGAGAYVKKPYAVEKIGVAIRDELLKANSNA